MSNDRTDSSHEPNRIRHFDVFLNFRGPDTRHSFVETLYSALLKMNIKTFMDQESLGMGVPILPLIHEAIEDSWASIVILSENYAKSKYCLDELVKIMECMETMNQTVLPIFYDVNPSDVGRLNDKAMAKLANRYGSDPETVQRWRSALSQVSLLKGSWHYQSGQQHENEQGFITRFIVESVVPSISPYDVFISFRGQDTGYAFTGNLYNALRQKKIKTFFINDELLKSGDQISSSFVKVIKNARISIVVLSYNYAYSPWSLDELANIIECVKTKNQLVWPIFYKVEPSHVRKQEKPYDDAMPKHENTSGKEKMQKWRSALIDVANLTGFPFGTGYEYELIQRIVKSAVQSLSRYDVFMSFSGEDTRYSFAGHLYHVLHQAGFKTFMDEEGLEISGNQFSETVGKVIENSKHSIIIFSENYGYHSWCLDELVKILECKKERNHLIWPIFYKVHPLDVRFQLKSYGDAMKAHEKRFGEDSDKVQKWRKALCDVTYLGGYFRKSQVNYRKSEHESQLIDQILEHLRFPESVSDDPELITSTSGFVTGLKRGNR